MDALKGLVSRAQYELEVDCYRGLRSLVQPTTQATRDCPWKSCQFCASAEVKEEENNIKKIDPEKNEVESMFQCSCPSLIQWRQQQKQQAKRKKKTTTHIPCKQIGSCKSNPFCLVSLPSDVMERVRYERICAFGQNGNPSPEKADEDIFAPATKEMLQQIRQKYVVKKDTILKHVESLLGEDSAPDILRAIQRQHDTLVFEPPTVYFRETETGPLENEIVMSLPPGIGNLGATCYLNTQIQCLAQNTKFLQGILSWTQQSHPEQQFQQRHNRMSAILMEFQSLLKQLRLGPCAVVNAEQFTQSLGLDHQEQQDPNEFSRLFLDQMHSTFQAPGTASDLKSLLPKLFQGIMAYETQCLKCMAVSKRPEQFMDLNLPIPSKPPPKKKASVLELMPQDPTVQECLNLSFGNPEHLDGDNQYFCEKCQEKCDATRQVKLEKLPPVLNVQLSRYVYDIRSDMKKKVSQKVLLDKVLCVLDKRYRLVAIMRHKGTSAYSGHYIAQAMDWCTGLWFEFNDTVVRRLVDGPDSAWENGSSSRKKKLPSGSSDAYNMYYVEEEFLAQSVWDISRERFPIPSPELLERYRMISDMCRRDQEEHRKMVRRKNTIRDAMNVFLPIDEHAVWVSNKELDQFLSGEEVTLSSPERCRHGEGLHPRQARCGKLLAAPVFEKYAELNGGCFLKMTPKGGLFCSQCSDAYRSELRRKYERVKTALRLFNTLHTEGSQFEDEIGEPLYVLSKKFVTFFKGQMMKLNKSAAKVTCLDDLDINHYFDSKLEPMSKELLEDQVEIIEETREPIVVNQSITCEHGVCDLKGKKRIMLVSRSTWWNVQELFPSVYEHKRRSDDVVEDCPECLAKTTKRQNRREELRNLLKHDPTIFSREYLMEQEIKLNPSGGSYRLIQTEDLKVWKTFLQAARRQLENCSVSPKAKSVLSPICPWDTGKMTCIASPKGRLSKCLSTIIRPILCTPHGLPIKSALFADEEPNRLYDESRLYIIEETSYQKLIEHWETVASETLLGKADGSTDEVVDTSVKWMHPVFRMDQRPIDSTTDKTSFVISTDSVSMRFSLEGHVCEDPVCNKLYSDWYDASKPPGSGSDQPIKIDVDEDCDEVPDVSPGLALSVYEVVKESSIDEFIADRHSLINMGSSGDAPSTVRRSTRKRKTRFPSGCILAAESVTVNFTSNVAALKLRLLQQLVQGNPFELSHELKFLIPHSGASTDKPTMDPTLFDLSVDRADTSLDELIATTVGKPIDDVPLELLRDLCIIRKSVDEESDLSRDELIAFFVDRSSDMVTSDEKGQVTGGTEKKRRRVERGFRGTFLSNSDDGNDAVETPDVKGGENYGENNDRTVDNEGDNDDGESVSILECLPVDGGGEGAKDNVKEEKDDPVIHLIHPDTGASIQPSVTNLHDSAEAKVEQPTTTFIEDDDSDADSLLAKSSGVGLSCQTNDGKYAKLLVRLRKDSNLTNETCLIGAVRSATTEQPHLELSDLETLAYSKYIELQEQQQLPLEIS